MNNDNSSALLPAHFLKKYSQPPESLKNPKSSSSVHTTSTKIQKPLECYRKHRLDERSTLEMSAVRNHLERANKNFSLDRLDSCRSRAFFVRQISTGKVRVQSRSCHVRFCPLCSAARSSTIRVNTEAWLKKQKFPKFITLTLKHTEDCLTWQIGRLYDSFKQLRRLKLFKKNVTGGIWFFELILTKKDEWHPHLHIAIAGKYIPQKKLSQEWERITTDSPIVDIRMIKDAKIAANYISKYAVKPIQLHKLSDERIDDVFFALKKRRLCGTWGEAKQARLTAKPVIDRNDWEMIGSWNVVTALLDFDPDAKAIWRAYKTGDPLDENITLQEYDDFIEDIPPPGRDRVEIESQKLLF